MAATKDWEWVKVTDVLTFSYENQNPGHVAQR